MGGIAGYIQGQTLLDQMSRKSIGSLPGILAAALSCTLCFGQAAYPVDPFAEPAPPGKKAAELVTCANGHKTIRDVPVIYGRPDEEMAEKARKGEIVLGGCNVGEAATRVVCATCRLEYDDRYSAWSEPPHWGNADKKTMPTPERIPNFPQVIGSVLPKEVVLLRWLNRDGLQGEALWFLTTAKASAVVKALSEWAPPAQKAEITKAVGLASGEVLWTKSGVNYRIDCRKGNAASSEFILTIEWHKAEDSDPKNPDQTAQPSGTGK